jgi:hypothetical protein
MFALWLGDGLVRLVSLGFVTAGLSSTTALEIGGAVTA